MNISEIIDVSFTGLYYTFAAITLTLIFQLSEGGIAFSLVRGGALPPAPQAQEWLLQ
ncbi:hypothetical protein [Noviherbaspirillum pedocola]|uniref:Uncharacterized protein n=1 Tax=Noviherbaspirillum pedocola TaxID=2801341 RepID=A0A934SVF7_9BURK|nr:hypothetical protein [Noviherbaspirillum pedocola]MBK4737310.1 hypothetical protein [Noviherbaspirillum pedocola]